MSTARIFRTLRSSQRTSQRMLREHIVTPIKRRFSKENIPFAVLGGVIGLGCIVVAVRNKMIKDKIKKERLEQNKIAEEEQKKWHEKYVEKLGQAEKERQAAKAKKDIRDARIDQLLVNAVSTTYKMGIYADMKIIDKAPSFLNKHKNTKLTEKLQEYVTPPPVRL